MVAARQFEVNECKAITIEKEMIMNSTTLRSLYIFLQRSFI